MNERDCLITEGHDPVRALSASVSAGALIITLAFLIWAMRRGFDITDEASYLIAMQYPRDVLTSASGHHWFLAPLFYAVGGNLWGLRLAGLALTLGATLVLLAGVSRALDRLAPPADVWRWRRWQERALVISGALLGYTWFLPTPSYNWLNAWAVTIAMGGLSAGLTGRERDTRRRPAFGWFVCVGACIALSFFAKFPTALSLAVCASAAVLFWPEWPGAERVRALVAIGLGLGGVFLVFFVAVERPDRWWSAFNEGLSMVERMRPNATTEVIFRYPGEIIKYVVRPGRTGALAIILALVVGAAGFVFAKRRGYTPATAGDVAVYTFLTLAACASFAYFVRLAPVEYFRHVARFDFAWLFFCGAAAAWWARDRTTASSFTPRGRWILVGLLFCAPFAGAVGSGTTINVSMRFTFGPWFVLFVALFRTMAAVPIRRRIEPIGLAVLSVLCAGQTIVGAFGGPYRLNTDLAGQTQPTHLGSAGTTVLLDPAAGRFFDDLRRTAAEAGFRPGDDVLAFFDMPGGVFALGGRSPGAPWFSAAWSGATALAESNLDLIGPERAGRAFLLETPSAHEWLAGLPARFGITFPSHYVLRGELRVPYPWPGGVVRLWQPVETSRVGFVRHGQQ